MGRYRAVETDRQERSYEARIWWAFWGIALIALIYTVFHQFREYDLTHNGQCIEAEYFTYNGQERARYYDENGGYHSYNLSGMDSVHGEHTILLYYKTNLSAAEPHIHPRVWIISYVLFVPLLAGASFRLYKIYCKNNQ